MPNAWDERYSVDEYVYGTEPNDFFRDKIASLNPGKALFPAEGEGRNSVHAASLGWECHAYDYSSVARKKAMKLASERNVNVNYDICNTEEFLPKTNEYDLVVAIFTHQPSAMRAEFHNKLIQSLKPGGHLILEAFSKEQMEVDSGGPKDLDKLYTMEILKQDFADVNIISLEQKTRDLKEGSHHSGKAHVLQLFAVKP